MKKIISLTLLCATSMLVFIAQGATKKTQCHLYKQLRKATLEKLTILEKEAINGDFTSSLALSIVAHECKIKKTLRIIGEDRGKATAKLKELELMNPNRLIHEEVCECLSEEVYEECKEIFEEDKVNDESKEKFANTDPLTIQKELIERTAQIEKAKKQWDEKAHELNNDKPV